MFSFTGSSRPRPMINLGGRSTSSSAANPAEIMRRAKEDRLLRESLKRQHAAATAIQAFWRSRMVASRLKSDWRQQFDHLLSLLPSDSSSISSRLWPHSYEIYLSLSRLILRFFTLGNPTDHVRLAKWANHLVLLGPLSPCIASNGGSHQAANSWRSVFSFLMVKLMLSTAAQSPRSEYCSVYLSAADAIVENVINRCDPLALLQIGSGWYWRFLSMYVLSFDADDKAATCTVSLAIQLSVKPFTPLHDPQFSANRICETFIAFAQHIFCIPLLPNRLPTLTLVQFSTLLPFEDLMLASPLLIDRLQPMEIISFLSNVLCWGSKKLPTLSPAGFESYLTCLQQSVDRVPSTVFDLVDAHLERKNRPIAAKVATSCLTSENRSTAPSENSDSIKTALHSPIPHDSLSASMVNAISPKTLQWLSTLISSNHLSSLFSVSNKYSATSRSHLCRLMVSMIFCWVSSKDKILNTLAYTALPTKDGKKGTNNSDGLMRELWRSSVRSGMVGVSLRDRKSGGSPQGVLTTLSDKKMTHGWEDLIMLSEMYSRCLMTLGDEEFFNDETKLTSNAHSPGNNSATVLSTGRNPLMLEEVVGLAGLLRNLAFGLYWTEGQADIKQGYVVGTKVSLEQLRALATRLLQQIYTRDSRRPFCGPDFWSMTSTFDQRSFIQTVVSEESNMERVREYWPQPPPHFENRDPHLNMLEHLGSPSAEIFRARFSRRQLAFISPRLGVLNNIPFVIPFEQRVNIFRVFIGFDRHRCGLDSHPVGGSRYKASIRRSRVSDDGFLHLSALGPRLKEPIEIKFIDEHGLEEAGIDGGGVFKEFLTSLTKEIFDANKGLWLVNKNQELYPNPHSYSREPLSLEWYAFLGRVLGKALYEGILIDVHFADFFLNKWLGKQSYLDDLASLDTELYQGLLFLKHYKGDVESDLSLNFALTVNEFDKSETVELIPNGAKTSVTASNRINYIYLVSNYKLNVQLEAQCAAFLKGLSEIIELKWLRMFNQVELKALVGGLVGKDLDVDDLQRWTVYGGWDESHPTIRLFWTVLRKLDNQAKRKLLKFVTSCSRPPLLGFKELRPLFAIRCSGPDQTRLPSSSTCVNLLKLPAYGREEVLREKLLYAINANAGFDLS